MGKRWFGSCLKHSPEALYLLMPLPFSSSDQSKLTAPTTEDRWTMSRIMIKVGFWFANDQSRHWWYLASVCAAWWTRQDSATLMFLYFGISSEGEGTLVRLFIRCSQAVVSSPGPGLLQLGLISFSESVAKMESQ